MRHKSVATLVLLVCVSPFFGHQQQPEKPVSEEELLMRPVAISPSPTSVNSAFQSAIMAAHAAGGEVLMQGCAEPSNSVVRPKEGSTLRKLLDDIVAADPDYRWEVKDGVVNLLPAKGVPDLLTLRIGAFDSGDARDAITAETFLFALPEVRQRTDELGLDNAGIVHGLHGFLPGAPPPPRLKVRLKDVTLLEALNALVRANKHGVWIYREIHCESTNHFDISLAE